MLFLPTDQPWPLLGMLRWRVLFGFGSRGRLETGNIPNLDSTMTSFWTPAPSFADVVVRRSCDACQCLL